MIGNVGDDLEVLGLHVSPDLDSILYALAGLSDEERGWGRAGKTWHALESARAFGGEAWFGSAIATSACTSSARRCSAAATPLSAATARLVARAGLETALLPATDDGSAPGSTLRPEHSRSRNGSSPEGIATRSKRVRFEGAESRARRAGRGRGARTTAELILVAPSNPYVSIEPDPRGRGEPRRTRTPHACPSSPSAR